MSTVEDDQWLTTKEVAARLRVEPATLRNWRHAGYGPLAVPFGRHRLYRESEIAEFEQERIEDARADAARRAKKRAS